MPGPLLAVLLLTTAAPADIVVVPAAADTTLLELYPDYNLGAQIDLPVGTLGPNVGVTRSRALLRFDLAAHLPPNAILRFATLDLTVTREPDGGIPSVFALHRMLQPWLEGSGSGPPPGGAPATPGEPTWTQRAHPQMAWSTPGGAPGLDFTATPDATETVAGVGPYPFELSSAALGTLIDWIARPDRNHGWMLLSQSEDVPKTARRFAARESPAGSPTLTIRYDPPPPAPRIVRFGVSSLSMSLEFLAEAGVAYAWESRLKVAEGPWELVQTVPPADTAGPIILTHDLPQSRTAFFRLRVLP